MIGWLINPDRTSGITKNYVFGCYHGCVFCYGKRIAKRLNMAHKMADVDTCFMYGPHWPVNPIAVKYHKKLEYNFYNFIPTFRPSVLAQKLPKKPTMIFFSMSDPAYWKQEWYEKILEKICNHMQHIFVILTKQPKIYRKYTFPHNCWLGITITNEMNLFDNISEIRFVIEYTNNISFISFEPLQEKLKYNSHIKYIKNYIDWIQIGFETGQRKGKVKGEESWLDLFWNIKVSIFMKESCSKVTSRELRQEWPEGYLNG